MAATIDCPSLVETLRARTTIRPHLTPTPLRRYESLCRLMGAEVWVKHENHNPTGTEGISRYLG